MRSRWNPGLSLNTQNYINAQNDHTVIIPNDVYNSRFYLPCTRNKVYDNTATVVPGQCYRESRNIKPSTQNITKGKKKQIKTNRQFPFFEKVQKER